jgi:hypothetical protein
LAALAAVDTPAAFVLVLPLAALLRSFARERRARVDHALELTHAYRGTALLLGDVVEADDAYTGTHSRDVVSLSIAVAEELGLDARGRRDTEFVALLHDVGKIRIENEIINKPGPLTPEERTLVETHTVVGERCSTGSACSNKQPRSLCHGASAAAAARRARRRCDPARRQDRLLLRRHSAITTDQPYRGRTAEEALEELRRCSKAQFDPDVVRRSPASSPSLRTIPVTSTTVRQTRWSCRRRFGSSTQAARRRRARGSHVKRGRHPGQGRDGDGRTDVAVPNSAGSPPIGRIATAWRHAVSSAALRALSCQRQPEQEEAVRLITARAKCCAAVVPGRRRRRRAARARPESMEWRVRQQRPDLWRGDTSTSRRPCRR